MIYTVWKQKLQQYWYELNFSIVKWWDDRHDGPAKRAQVREEQQARGPAGATMEPLFGKYTQSVMIDDETFTSIRTIFTTQEEADAFLLYVRINPDMEPGDFNLVEFHKQWDELVKKHNETL